MIGPPGSCKLLFSYFNKFPLPIPITEFDPIDVPHSLMSIIHSCNIKSNLVLNKGSLPRFFPSKLLTITAFPGSVDFHFLQRLNSYAFFQSRTVLSFNSFSLKCCKAFVIPFLLAYLPIVALSFGKNFK